MTNPSPRPRVLLESDAGAMDQLIRRGEQAATVAEQKALELAQAGQGLEQLKATVPATAKSAAELATAQAKATLDAATLAANQAAVTAQTATATLPKFRSTDQNNPPAPTQGELDANPNGIGGSRLTADGATQLLKWTPHTTAGAWVASGAPLPTTTQVADAKKAAVDAATLADNAKEAADTAKSVADTAQTAATGARRAASHTSRATLEGTLDIDPQFFDGDRWLLEAVADMAAVHIENVMFVKAAQENAVWRRESDQIHMRYFGARAGKDNTQAWQDAIEYANARGGVVTFQIGSGVYELPDGDALPEINKSRVGWRGQGHDTELRLYNGNPFRWRGLDETRSETLVIGGGLADLQLSHLDGSGNPDATICSLSHTSSQRYRNLKLEQARQLIRAGGGYRQVTVNGVPQWYDDKKTMPKQENTGQSYDIVVSDLMGGKRNDGRSLIRLTAGFGFYLLDGNMYVSGVLTPEPGDPISTVYGTHMVEASEGRWDTLDIRYGLYERFSHWLRLLGRIDLPKLNVRVHGISADYNADHAILLETQSSGVIANVKLFQPYVTSWRGGGIASYGEGAIFNMAIDNPQPHLCAEHGIRIEAKVRRMSITAPQTHATGMTTPGAPSVLIGPDVQHWSLKGGYINAESDDEGSAYQSTIGLMIQADSDHYEVDTRVYGPIPYYIEPNTTASAVGLPRYCVAEVKRL